MSKGEEFTNPDFPMVGESMFQDKPEFTELIEIWSLHMDQLLEALKAEQEGRPVPAVRAYGDVLTEVSARAQELCQEYPMENPADWVLLSEAAANGIKAASGLARPEQAIDREEPSE